MEAEEEARRCRNILGESAAGQTKGETSAKTISFSLYRVRKYKGSRTHYQTEIERERMIKREKERFKERKIEKLNEGEIHRDIKREKYRERDRNKRESKKRDKKSWR